MTEDDDEWTMLEIIILKNLFQYMRCTYSAKMICWKLYPKLLTKSQICGLNCDQGPGRGISFSFFWESLQLPGLKLGNSLYYQSNDNPEYLDTSNLENVELKTLNSSTGNLTLFVPPSSVVGIKLHTHGTCQVHRLELTTRFKNASNMLLNFIIHIYILRRSRVKTALWIRCVSPRVKGAVPLWVGA